MDGGNDLVFVPLEGLLDIALYQGDGGGAAVGTGEIGLLEGVAGAAQGSDARQRQQAFFQTACVVNQQNQPCAGTGRRQRNQMDAAYGGESCQRAVRDDLRIAQRAPAEAGEQAFAGKFRQCPQ